MLIQLLIVLYIGFLDVGTVAVDMLVVVVRPVDGLSVVVAVLVDVVGVTVIPGDIVVVFLVVVIAILDFIVLLDAVVDVNLQASVRNSVFIWHLKSF